VAVHLANGWAVLTKTERTIVVSEVSSEKLARAIAALPNLIQVQGKKAMDASEERKQCLNQNHGRMNGPSCWQRSSG
jgi:hypothetical protein